MCFKKITHTKQDEINESTFTLLKIIFYLNTISYEYSTIKAFSMHLSCLMLEVNVEKHGHAIFVLPRINIL